MRNRIAEVLEERGVALGTWVQMKNPEACELAAGAGFDFVIIDMEHGSFGLEGAVEMIRAVESQEAAAVLRVPDGSIAGIKKSLDTGVAGIIIPGIRTGEEARQIVQAARYEPGGTRGACPSVRATRHSLIDWKQYREWSERNTMVWGLIENRDAVENISSIVSSGLNAIVLGPFDLSVSLGLNGDVDHPEVTRALDRVVEVAVSNGVEVVTVLFETDPDGVLRSAQLWKKRGVRIITALTDRWCLCASYRNVINALRR